MPFSPSKNAADFVNEVEKFDEIFLASTTSEVMPVIEIDERTIGNGKPGPITIKLQNEFSKLY